MPTFPLLFSQLREKSSGSAAVPHAGIHRDARAPAPPEKGVRARECSGIGVRERRRWRGKSWSPRTRPLGADSSRPPLPPPPHPPPPSRRPGSSAACARSSSRSTPAPAATPATARSPATSVQCTESFMRENVMDELKQMQPEDESKKKMLDILKRFHLEEEEMESEGDDKSILSEELIQKVMSDEIKLEDLSDDELKRFHQALASGELSKMIEPWTPWWKKPSAKLISLSPDGSQLIRHVSVEDTAMSDPMADPESSIDEIPEGPESPLPSLKQLTRAEQSPLLAVHLVDILYSYCFTLRLYNGDWHSDPFGASTVALSVSKVMGEDAKPETVSEALTACIEETCSPAYRHTGGFGFAIGLVDDVISLLTLGGNALVCALCDFRRLIHTGERMLKGEKLGKTERARSTQKLRGADRKLYFMTCWVHEQPNEAWPSLARLVEVQKASLEELDCGQLQRAGRKNDAQSKVLIEEI